MGLFESVKGKVVIVTGASSGIGQSIAKVFAEAGMKVVCVNRNKAKGLETVKTITSDGGEAVFFQADMSKPSDIEAMVDFALQSYGRLDGLVNNAGIGMGGSPLHEYCVEDFEQIDALNLEGVFVAMKHAVKAILVSKSQSGFIINVASIAGLLPQSGQSLYSATKSGVIGMTKAAALDYAPHNITINAICPGYTETPIFGDAPKAAMSYFNAACPSGRMGKPEECAYLALFLASDMARYISGAAIPVDGALSAGQRNVLQWKEPLN